MIQDICGDGLHGCTPAWTISKHLTPHSYTLTFTVQLINNTSINVLM